MAIPHNASGVDLLDQNTVAYATLQQHRDNWVVAAVPHLARHTLSIFLKNAVSRDTSVAWLLLD